MEPMALNIKNQRVHELARRAAAVTGRSQTGAIEEALEMLLAAHDQDPTQLRAAAKVDRALEVVAHYQAADGRGDREIRRVEDLFDTASGLPR